MFFLTYLRRELRRRIRQATVIALGLALGVGLVVTVTALSSGVRTAQGKILGALYGVGTDITVTSAGAPGRPGGGFGQITPEPYAQHSDTLTSPNLGTLNADQTTAIARLRGVAAATGALVLTEIATTIPADNVPPPPSLPAPVQTSVAGVDPGHAALGPLGAARLTNGRTFSKAQANANVTVVDENYAAAHDLHTNATVTIAGTRFTVIGIVRQALGTNPPELYIPLARAQALSRLPGQVNEVYVQAASAAGVGAVTTEISRLRPAMTVTDAASLASEVAGSLRTTAQLARSLGTWLAVLALLAAFAVASLLTLAAVARRAREFGTLKALGWRSTRITAQVVGETVAEGIAGAALGVALGLASAQIVSMFAPRLSATVQTASPGASGGFGGSQGSGGGLFEGTVGGPVQTFANPNAAHTVAIPFSAQVTAGAIVLAVVLAIAGALVAGSIGGWQIGRLRPAAALARPD